MWVTVFQLVLPSECCSGFDNNFRRPHKKCPANNLHTGRGFSLPLSDLPSPLPSPPPGLFLFHVQFLFANLSLSEFPTEIKGPARKI